MVANSFANPKYDNSFVLGANYAVCRACLHACYKTSSDARRAEDGDAQLSPFQMRHLGYKL